MKVVPTKQIFVLTGMKCTILVDALIIIYVKFRNAKDDLIAVMCDICKLGEVSNDIQSKLNFESETSL